MILIGMALPLFYLLFISNIYGLFLKKRVDHILAISFFVQILIMLITSIVIKSLTAGIILYVLGIAIAYVIYFVRYGFKQFILFFTSSDYVESIIFICVVYFFIYVANYGTYFSDWDEFSHWGIFAKEMYRLDMLYCTSPITMAHQDYVPAISIFETLWCKLSFRYTDANAYRGMQILQASMLLPMISAFSDRKSNDGHNKILYYFIGIIIVFGGLLFFGKTYHTIYQDIIYGVLVFFCMYLVITERKSLYKTIIITIALTILVMAKMTAMAFLPMIVIFDFVWSVQFEKEYKKRILSCVLQISIPTIFWMWYKSYADSFVSTDGGQSYNGLFQNLINLISHAQTYQKEVLWDYIKALFSVGIFSRAPFVLVIIAISLFIVLIQNKQTDPIETKKVRLVGMWVILASVAYALMTGVLYLLAFSEYEARMLASYSRYFSTIMVADYLLLVLVCFIYINSSLDIVYSMALVVIIENMLFFFDVSQLLPGKIVGEAQLYSSEVDAIQKYVSEEESVLVITHGSSGFERVVLQYYCTPRNIEYISIGKTGDDDMWGQDIDASQLADLVDDYNYVYIFEIPDSILEDYEQSFMDAFIIQNFRLYQSKVEDGKIVLEEPTVD